MPYSKKAEPVTRSWERTGIREADTASSKVGDLVKTNPNSEEDENSVIQNKSYTIFHVQVTVPPTT